MEYKQAIYPVEEWEITEEGFSMDFVYRNETTFALSNGYFGTRGTFEEGYDFSEEEGLEGNFINGFYESEAIRYGEWNYGFPTESQSLLNLPDLKPIRLFLEEEEFDMRLGKLEVCKRVLHMERGYVSRDVVWESPKGRRVRIHTERLVSFQFKNRMVMSYQVTPLNFSGTIRLRSELRADVENHTGKTNPLVDYGPFGKHLILEEMTVGENSLFYQGKTLNSGLTMACGSSHKLRDAGHGELLRGYTVKGELSEKEEKGWITYEMLLEEGRGIQLDKFIAYSSVLDMPGEELGGFLEKELTEAGEMGFEAMKAEQESYMRKYWETADIKIHGETHLQQGIRFNLFHILQAPGRDGRTGMGAKGLTGEGYEGHYFWDTEMYVLPVFVYTNPELAKSILDYRFHTLEEARERARVLGHEKGALYPWRTINGKEASTYFPLGTAQYHINGDIAYAYKLYVDVSGDYQYLEEKAAEVLLETARVWADVGCFAESRGNRYCICAVTGPDEYNAIVDNNFYTNLMARENIRAAIWALDTIRERNGAACEALVEKLHLEGEEIVYWKRIVENMYFPFDDKRGIYPQDDGFLQRKPWDDSRIPVEKRHLLYENYHPLFIFRQRMCKQADAVLGMFLYSNLFTREELRLNYDFYQEVTLHHSSLSTCVFGMLANQIGYYEEAYSYFAQSARMDLDDYHDNFYAGIHAANMAGSWQAIVFGFGGVRTNGGGLEFHVTTPETWEGYEFKLIYRGSLLKIESGREKAVYTLLNQQPVVFQADGEEYCLNQKGESISLPIRKRSDLTEREGDYHERADGKKISSDFF